MCIRDSTHTHVVAGFGYIRVCDPYIADVSIRNPGTFSRSTRKLKIATNTAITYIELFTSSHCQTKPSQTIDTRLLLQRMYRVGFMLEEG